MKEIAKLIFVLFSGGFAGALFTQYWINRQTVIGYSLNTTILGAGQATKSVLPTLKLQLDNVEVPAVFTHTIELTHSGGPEVEEAQVGILFTDAKMLGNVVVDPPDPVHSLRCSDISPTTKSFVCSLGRVGPNKNPYRITFATDVVTKIDLTVNGRNTRIERLEGSSGYRKGFGTDYLTLAAFASVLMALTIDAFRSLRRYRKQGNEMDNLLERAQLAVKDLEAELLTDKEKKTHQSKNRTT